MPPELTAPASTSPLERIVPVWRRPLALLAAAFVALLLLFTSDWRAMAWQWWDSSTFNHVLLIPPIIAWLVWLRIPKLAELVPQAWWPGLLVYAAAAVLWLLGAFSGLSVARQAGVVGMTIALVPTLLGPRVTAGLFFPLCYAALLVPIGEEIVPQLQMITAWLTIGLVRLSGIPAVIDGVFIDTPVGLFEVAEACSGVKFLIAMIAFGLLVANVCFVSWRRRVLFMIACVIVPVLANGVRAFATILAAQYVGPEKATGIDHLIYGWVFFAVVIAIIMAASWRFFDRPVEDPMIDPASINANPLLARWSRLAINRSAALASLGGIALAVLLWAGAADRLEASVPKQVFLPQVPGWTRADYAPQVRWAPQASGARHRLLGSYTDGRGHKVDVFLAVYSAQREGAEATGFGEGALMPGGTWAWHSPGHVAPSASTQRMLALGRVGRVAETYYRHGDDLTGSSARLKLALIRDRLLLRQQPTTMLILSAEEGENPAEAVSGLEVFRQSTGPLDLWIDRILKPL